MGSHASWVAPLYKMPDDKIAEMIKARQAPGMVVSGRVPRSLSYDHYHAPTHLPIQARQAEQDGAFKRNPQLRDYLIMRCRNVKGKEEIIPHVDYQKLGHPCSKSKQGIVFND